MLLLPEQHLVFLARRPLRKLACVVHVLLQCAQPAGPFKVCCRSMRHVQGCHTTLAVEAGPWLGHLLALMYYYICHHHVISRHHDSSVTLLCYMVPRSCVYLCYSCVAVRAGLVLPDDACRMVHLDDGMLSK